MASFGWASRRSLAPTNGGSLSSSRMPKVRRSHFLLGAHGLAVLRGWMLGENAVGSRVSELLKLTKELDRHPLSVEMDLDELDVLPGYTLWSETYDGPNNALISVEEPAVQSILDGFPIGTALDTACGTGRYTFHLRERGFNVAAVDGSPAMLSKAIEKVPSAQFALADVSSLPFSEGLFDVALCALALDHCSNLGASVAELSRVLKRNGHLVILVFHPANAIIGGGAFFSAADGHRGIVRNYWHSFADYVTAFVGAGLEIEACLEREWSEREVMMMSTAKFARKACIAAFAGVPLVLVRSLRRT